MYTTKKYEPSADGTERRNRQVFWVLFSSCSFPVKNVSQI